MHRPGGVGRCLQRRELSRGARRSVAPLSGRRLGAGLLASASVLTFTVPIGARLSLPGLTNTMISILKNSALMLGIGLAELTFTVQRLSAETFRTVELFVVLGIVYLALVLVLSSVMHLIGRRYTLGAGV